MYCYININFTEKLSKVCKLPCPNTLIMIFNKYKLSLILSILFLSCSFLTDSKDSAGTDITANPLVGTWNATSIKYFQ